MNKKFVLILGAGYEQLPLYTLCIKKSLKIIGVDKNPNAPGFKFADQKIITSIREDKNLINKIKKINKKISAVITIANDIPLIQYKISKALKLKSISKVSANLSADKSLFFKKFSKEKINIPNYQEIKKKINLKNLIIKKNSFPLILKPRDGRGSRGVFYIKNNQDIRNYIEKSFQTSKKKTLILQKYINGIQLSTESIIYNKKIYTSIGVRNYKDTKNLYPHIIENGGYNPAKISNKLEKRIDRLLIRVASLLKIKEGPLKCDLVINKKKIYLLEAAPRFGGGFVASHVTKLLYNFNFLEAYLNMLLGKNIEKINFKKNKIYVCVRFVFSNKIGKKIKKIINLNYQKYKKNIIHFVLYKKKNSYIVKVESHADRIGYVSTFHKKKSTAIQIANKFVSGIKIIT